MVEGGAWLGQGRCWPCTFYSEASETAGAVRSQLRNNRLQAILRDCFNAAYPGAAGLLVYFEVGGRGIGDPQFEASFDLLICDEAQRMRRASISVALSRAPVSVVFLDETQRLNPPEEGTVKAFEDAAETLGRHTISGQLSAAVRCRGGQPYHDWVERLTG